MTARLPERVERQILATGLSNAGDLVTSASWGDASFHGVSSGYPGIEK